ncbi:MAG: cytochrome c [Alphaproteobacteria bacterium]|nr:cytochrome c [Alphaproteobacteria bacterium]
MPRRTKVYGLLGLLALAGALPGAPSSADPDAERRQGLRHLLLHDCGSCHGLTMRGGLGRPLLPESLADKSDEALTSIILHGMPGTPMPPWAAEIDEDEALWLVTLLRGGVSLGD